MRKINPLISQKFLEAIKNQKHKMKVVEGVKIMTCPGVYPPQSGFSRATKKLHNIFGNINGKIILDIGTATGIQAIHAAINGAEKVIATDISKKAVECAKKNVALNNLEDKITVIKSDLFERLPKIKFDVIVANLPIVDYPAQGIVGFALYDHGLKIHKKLFNEAPKYLKNNGSIIFCHANLQSDDDFKIIESIIQKTSLHVTQTFEKKQIGYVWKMYKLKLK